jgi:hypothetical protein
MNTQQIKTLKRTNPAQAFEAAQHHEQTTKVTTRPDHTTVYFLTGEYIIFSNDTLTR